MPEDQAHAIAAFLAAHPDCKRLRYMSRREVWQRGQADLIRVPMMEMPRFLPAKTARELKVRDNGTIAFSDALYYGRDEMIYRADKIRTPAGCGLLHIGAGERVTVKYNPLVPDHIWLIDRESGATLGMAPLYGRAPMYDRHAIEIAMGAQSADIARKMIGTHGRHQQEAEERAHGITANRILLGQAAPLKKGRAQKQTDAANSLVAVIADEYDERDDYEF